jgi:RimJ/RimL family protein N-acetyltransferase
MKDQQLLPERVLSGEPIATVPDGRRPERTALDGITVRLEPLESTVHGADLFGSTHADQAGTQVWDYLPYGPFASEALMRAWLEGRAASADPLFFAVRDRISNRAGGMVTFMNIVPANGSLEIGHIWFAPFLQNTRQSTEALFLLMRHTFDTLGYRRLEWKCNALNQASRNAAARLGFSYEGTFYQHMIVKGKNRDTAWFSLLDSEWPTVRANFEAWLNPANFDTDGIARTSLGELNRGLRGQA